jgi:hypothetical protein
MADEERAATEVTERDIESLGGKLREFARTLLPGEQGAFMQLVELAAAGGEGLGQGEGEGFARLRRLGLWSGTAFAAERLDLGRIGVRRGVRFFIIC